MGMVWILNLIRWIQLCDKRNLTVICWLLLSNFIKLVLKMLLSSPKARLITFLKTRLIKKKYISTVNSWQILCVCDFFEFETVQNLSNYNGLLSTDIGTGRGLQTIGVRINPVPNKPWFLLSAVQVLWKHCGKGEIARNEQFLLFPQCFLLVLRTFCHFHQIWNRRLQIPSVWEGLNFLFGKGVDKIPLYI